MIIKQRSEILFLYDVTDANPNGDPLDENKPRIDEENGQNLVTDVRLKRTIRDFLFNFKGYNGQDGKDIFVREIKMGEGIQDGKARAKDFKENAEQVLAQAIDIRLFGGVIPLNKDSITYTGPVQFNMGRSYHRVAMKHIKGTGAFASTAEKKQATFREEYLLPYSLIGFYGVVNEKAAQETKMTAEDLELLMESLWLGTKNLITRSKMGHMPRFLLRVEYQKENYFLGELHKKIKIVSQLEDEKLRSIEDYQLDISQLLKALIDNKEKISKICCLYDHNLSLVDGERKVVLAELPLEIIELSL